MFLSRSLFVTVTYFIHFMFLGRGWRVCATMMITRKALLGALFVLGCALQVYLRDWKVSCLLLRSCAVFVTSVRVEEFVPPGCCAREQLGGPSDGQPSKAIWSAGQATSAGQANTAVWSAGQATSAGQASTAVWSAGQATRTALAGMVCLRVFCS